MSRELICPVCGQEWELDTLHEEVAARDLEGLSVTFTNVVRQFQREGCSAALRATQDVLGPIQCVPDPDDELAAMARTFYELLGDDIDGAINEIEDYRMMFGDH